MIIPQAPSVAEMSEGLGTIPEATYNLKVVKSEYVAVPKSKDAKGPYIKAQLKVIGPGDNPQLGRFVFMNYSLTGEGSFRLRQLLEVTNHPPDFKLTDSDQILNLEFGAAVIIKEGKDGYPDKNEVKQHLALLSALFVLGMTAMQFLT